MSELDILKKHWQKVDKSLPKYSYDELYQMLHKKSSSMVKWIFIISLIEFALWGVLYFIVPNDSQELNESMGLNTFVWISSGITLVAFIFFITLFYHNYSKIRVTDSIKQLMNSILRTRQTVYFFIIWNIVSTFIAFIVVFFYFRKNETKLIDYIIELNPDLNLENSQVAIQAFFIGYAFTALVVVGIMLLLYRIIYIRLLKRLKKNYKQLQAIESDFEQS